jgi:hypothetical protein
VWRKNAHCAGSLRIIISGRSLCWPWHLPPSHMGGNQGSLLAPSRVLNALKVDWQRHVLSSTAPFSYSRWTDRAKGSPASRTRPSGREHRLGIRLGLSLQAEPARRSPLHPRIAREGPWADREASVPWSGPAEIRPTTRAGRRAAMPPGTSTPCCPVQEVRRLAGRAGGNMAIELIGRGDSADVVQLPVPV